MSQFFFYVTCTYSAAVLINCFAGSLQITGMVKTQKTSEGRTVVCLVMAFKACFLKKPIDSLKTVRKENGLPVVSFIFISFCIICTKKDVYSPKLSRRIS